MDILSFHDDTENPLRSPKMTKSSYLPQMTSNPKNKGTFFSSTLKVEDKKVPLFFCLEVNLVRYGNFEILPILPFLGQRGPIVLFTESSKKHKINILKKFSYSLHHREQKNST